MSFECNQPYNESDPRVIKSDAIDLVQDYDYSEEYRRLVFYLDTDTLRSFIDDRMMGRV